MGRTVIGLLLFFIILLIVFSIPAVQTSVANRIANSLNNKYDVDMSIGKVDFTYSGRIKLEDVLVRDHHEDTLIYTEEMRTSVLSLSALMDVKPRFGSTILEEAEVNMKIYEGESQDNLSIFVDKFKPEQPTGKQNPFRLTASNIEIIDGSFSYVNENLNNPEILVFDPLYVNAENFLLDGSDVSVDIQKISGREKRGLEVSFLSTLFSYTSNSMELVNFELETPQSVLKGEIVFDTSNGFGDFFNSVEILAGFEEASLSTNDLQPFYNKFGDDQQLDFSTTLEGTLNDFRLHNFSLNGMDRSVLDGEIVITDLFSEEQVFIISGDLEQFSTNYYDLINLLPGVLAEALPIELQRFGNVTLRGNAIVTASSLTADVLLTSQLGAADVDMVLEDFGDSSLASYEGNLKVTDFNVGKLVGNAALGKTSFDVDIDGSGFTTETLNTDVRGAISKLRYNGYTYNNIKIRGTLRAPVFNGNLVSMDPNLNLEFNGLADFSQETNVYDFEASVGYADLAALNFIKRDSVAIFKGDIITNLRGTDVNDAAGALLLLNTSYRNENDLYYFDDLRITSSFDGPVRTIEVNSPDVINGTIVGDFDVNQVQALFENAVGSLYTNYQPNKLTTNQYLEFDFDIYNKIVEVFFPEITLAPNTFIRGRVESDESDFRLTFRSPEINAFNNMLQQVNVQVDNTNPLFNTFIEVDSVATGVYNLSDFNLINVTMNDTLFVRSEFRGGPKDDDIYNLNLYHTINEENNSVVGIQRSDIKFKESVWYLNEDSNRSNRVILRNGLQDIRIDSLVLSHQDEEIRLNGQIRDSTYKDIKMQFDKVNLSKITPNINNLALGGIVDGTLNLLQRDRAYYPNTSLTIQDIEVNDERLGNLFLDVMGNEDLTFYNINTTLQNEGLESLSAIGEIVVDRQTPEIDLDVSLRNFDLSAFSPLGGVALDNIRGMVSGNADVTGNYKNPDISGSLLLQDAGLRIPYLNVDLDFEENSVVNLSEQQFIFEEIQMTDTQYGTTGILDGTISHQNFSDWNLGLNISTDRLLVLDTDQSEDALYYGTAFISGNAAIYGPTDELVIDVIGATESGTVFKIPISDTETVGDNSFIHFLSPEEKAARLAGGEIEIEEVKGLELNFDLDVTNDALVELDLDGSILRGKGAGTLLIEINTLGKFKMWGDFIANSGEYIFNYGALQKRFDVRPGGSINWSGNPAQADLNISAVYEAHANPAIILDNPSISRRIPVDVVINLQGELLQPDITFDLEYPNATSAVSSELEYRVETGTTKDIQAFSLITLGQFYTPNVLAGNSGTAVAGNLFESASGFFNSLLSDDSGVFQVGLNYEQGARTPEQTTADRFGVTLSTQISERVLINGQVGVPVGGVTETVIVGNIEIEFLLNEEGNLRAKIFNRENNIQYFGEELGFTQGVGLSYQVDFDTFRELIRKITDAEQSPVRKEEEEVEVQKSLAPDYIRFPGENGR